MYIIKIRYYAKNRWNYAYLNKRMKITTRKAEAWRFLDEQNAADAARIWTKNTRYEGVVQYVNE